MVRNIIISLCLILLFGCKELYFKYPQPRGGKVFNGNLKQMFISAIPTTINSNGRNSILNDIVNDTLQYIAMNNNRTQIELELQFFNGITILEKFNIQSTIDSFLTLIVFGENDGSIILEKENIICINQKNEKDDSIFKIPFIFERNRKNNDLRVVMNPFMLETEDLDNMKDELNIIKYYDNDSSKVYVADPSYMSFRKYLKGIYEYSFTDILITELFDQFEKRVELDSIKYKNIKGLINFKEIKNLGLDYINWLQPPH
ncbi:uncharacterized protein METZ01_LOCUS402976 [marine metagenome]|uniref:Uncharacterized protein n=1 Tax=marine metagenome TaxID=408172 RepID=A0A382VUD8_9ZZZZ